MLGDVSRIRAAQKINGPGFVHMIFSNLIGQNAMRTHLNTGCEHMCTLRRYHVMYRPKRLLIQRQGEERFPDVSREE